MEAVERLGGVCVDCGYRDNLDALQIDHVDPAQKTLLTTELLRGSYGRFVAELGRCQLLCANCHAIKTKEARRSGGRG